MASVNCITSKAFLKNKPPLAELIVLLTALIVFVELKTNAGYMPDKKPMLTTSAIKKANLLMSNCQKCASSVCSTWLKAGRNASYKPIEIMAAVNVSIIASVIY